MLHWHPLVLKVIARDHIEDRHYLSNKERNHNRSF